MSRYAKFGACPFHAEEFVNMLYEDLNFLQPVAQLLSL